MAKQIRKGTELNNVSETWDENERRRASGGTGSEDLTDRNSEKSDLEQVIQKEAAEYDNDDKEGKLLGGERATLNDDEEINT